MTQLQQENLHCHILAWQSATEEWRLLYDKGISICVASRSNKTSREICSKNERKITNII